MSNLVLEVKPGEMMIINGATLRFRSKTRIELTSHARFLFGKQLMPRTGASTAGRRIYYALQTAYIGEAGERAAALEQARALIGIFREATSSEAARLILNEAETAAMDDRCYVALKLVRRIIRLEDEQDGHDPSRNEERGMSAAIDIPDREQPGASGLDAVRHDPNAARALRWPVAAYRATGLPESPDVRRAERDAPPAGRLTLPQAACAIPRST